MGTLTEKCYIILRNHFICLGQTLRNFLSVKIYQDKNISETVRFSFGKSSRANILSAIYIYVSGRWLQCCVMHSVNLIINFK